MSKEPSADLQDRIVMMHIPEGGYKTFICGESFQEHSGLQHWEIEKIWNFPDST
jgi:hypothetical protein